MPLDETNPLFMELAEQLVGADPLDGARCDRCRFFRPMGPRGAYQGAPDYGQCRRAHPTNVGTGWSPVGPDDWCGEFERRFG